MRDVKQVKERLADTHDLQAEISLEGERFSNATEDLRAALRLKLELYAEDSSLIAEAHYKLSLALEFSSVTQQEDAGQDGAPTQEAFVDESMREEAAREMEAAIRSCKSRIAREKATLDSTNSLDREQEGTKVTRDSVDEVKGNCQGHGAKGTSPPKSV